MIGKPSDKEQEYFVNQELQRLAKLREEHRRAAADAEAKARRDLHFMHCAKCGTTMTTTTLGGVEVEVCPSCGGVYLDAGELDKMLEDKRRGPFAAALTAVRGIFRE